MDLQIALGCAEKMNESASSDDPIRELRIDAELLLPLQRVVFGAIHAPVFFLLW